MQGLSCLFHLLSVKSVIGDIFKGMIFLTDIFTTKYSETNCTEKKNVVDVIVIVMSSLAPFGWMALGEAVKNYLADFFR